MVKLGTWLDARLSVPVLAGSLAGAAHSNRPRAFGSGPA
jgi:hypothetical protein